MAEKKDSAKNVKSTTTAKKAEPAKTATTAKKVEPAKTATTAKKTEPAKTATTAKKTEPAKTATTAKKTEPAKTATTAKKTEPAKTATTAKKTEPAKTATTAKKAEPVKATETAKPSFADRKKSVAAGAVATSLVEDNDHSKPEKAQKPEKTQKTAKASNASKEKKSDGNKKKTILIASIASACVFVVLLSIILGVTLGKGGGKNPVAVLDRYDITAHTTNTVVRYGEQTLGTVDRNKPVAEVKNEASAFSTSLLSTHDTDRYPTYGKSLGYVLGSEAEKVEARNALINEAAYLAAWGTHGANRGGEQTPDKYTKIDKDGWLYQYKDGKWIHSCLQGTTDYNNSANWRQLYKHTGSKGLYGGDVSDSEQAIVKELTFSPRDYLCGYNVTGLYAPAGEVIKIQMSGADMTATGGITVHIGQALYNGQANNIWAGKNQMQRMPIVLTTLQITKDTAEYDENTDTWTAYVGSFLGGPIYVRNKSVTFNTTISGAVPYSHFILGYTTKEEFEQNSKSSAPYFDLEVWDNGVLHSGPKSNASKFSYDDLYQAAVLWDKVSSVTASGGSKYGIVFLYDPFVAAGAAVAFPGRNSVNCPSGWMAQSLNYNSLVTSGSWGNFHEYHHNFQNYGLGSGADGEVTNNGLNLVSYSLFTKISSSRQISGYGGAGLSGWNRYTSATWALNQVNTGSIGSTNGLAIYATLLHNLGQDQYIKARGASGSAYLNKWATNTHQDMTYYAGIVSSYGFQSGGSYSPSQAVKDANYPLFVPVASVYQTGRTYNYDGEKREIITMQPYVIPYGKPFTVDLRSYEAPDGQYASGSVVIDKNNFDFKIKSVNASGSNGTFVATDTEGVYTFTPNSKELRSGKIYVTLEITAKNKPWTDYKIQDVDLVLEFQQSHEMNKNVLERTTYYYTADTAYKDARAAYEAGYANYTSKVDRDHSNPTQNANTDIWYCTEGTISKFPKADPELAIVKPYSIDEIRGKLYFPEAGKYSIYLRGRRNCAVYYSVDGGNKYQLGTFIADSTTSADWRKTADGKKYDKYFTLEVEAESWVYVKEVLINEKISDGMTSFIGLGIGSWTVPMYTAEVKYTAVIDGKETTLTQEENEDGIKYYYTKDKNKVYVESSLVKTDTVYKDSNGKVVSAAQASVTDPIEPSPEVKNSISYATAYRQSYEFQKQFESDYFYTRSYSYNYQDNISVPQDEVALVESNYAAPPTGWGWGNFPIANLTDGKTGTYIHTNWKVTEAKPLSLTFDIGAERKINRIQFYCRNNNGMLETPKAFTVEGCLDGSNWFEVAAFTDAPRSGNYVTVDFDETTLRYCRIKISSTHQGSYYVVIGQIWFTHSTEVLGGNLINPDNNMFTYKGNWYGSQAKSNFGHVYVGKKGATVTFEFEGTRLGILSSKAYGSDFEVTIDKKKVSSIDLKQDSSASYASFISGELASGKHKVTIKCKDIANIDSYVIYP